MSAEPYADPTLPGAPLGPVAQPAVDILPSLVGRKAKHPEAEREHGAPFDVAAPAAEVMAAETTAPEPLAVASMTPVAVPQPIWGAAPPAVEQGEAAPLNPWTGQTIPPAEAVTPGMDVVPDADAEGPSAKRFLGMQLRRQRKAEEPGAALAQQPESAAEVTVAAWPTDVGVPVVADAEPAPQAWAGPPQSAYAAADVMTDAPVDVPPAEAPAEVPTEAVVAFAPVPVEADAVAPVPVEADAVAPVPVEADAVAPVPVVAAVPVPALHPADEELRTLRTMLDASEARRAAAEQRADQAVAYGQQLQAELTRVREDLEGRLRAAETRARAAANEAQDWQIRHREAETQVQELAQSVGGAEQRLADLRSERDELLAALEEATNPAAALAQPVQQD